MGSASQPTYRGSLGPEISGMSATVRRCSPREDAAPEWPDLSTHSFVYHVFPGNQTPSLVLKIRIVAKQTHPLPLSSQSREGYRRGVTNHRIATCDIYRDRQLQGVWGERVTGRSRELTSGGCAVKGQDIPSRRNSRCKGPEVRGRTPLKYKHHCTKT